ncbi:Up-regulated during septation-domain-containing protein [Collybia nuda]|uniref:Up-regulated during septation-domain-containing protein n=1 Tax=Collybia nuda TaxID=64659 RepID=A0A9P5Y9U7_9AGAR|nr:Up-regulated during septation-domain-containing protein [Collybia nuda]
MNGVRRFLGAATGIANDQQEQVSSQSPPQLPPQSPPVIYAKPLAGPSWPPPSPTQTQPAAIPVDNPKPTAALFFRKDRQRRDESPPAPSPPSNGRSSPTASSSSSPRVLPNRISRKSVPDSEWKRTSVPLNTRDELLISLLASEAVVDSRGFEILPSEQVDDLKKEHQVLTARLGAMTKKLALETKIRDAAVSLTKVNASNKRVSKQSDEQLEAAKRRVDAAQHELWRVSALAYDVHRKLLEHRAGVLSFSVRSMEKKINSNASEDSGYDSSNRSTLMSPPSSMTGISGSSKARFDGAHFFAGHAEAITPRKKLSAEAAAAEIIVLEEKLRAATESLTAAGKKQVEMRRELALMQLEKQEVETLMGMELQSAEENIGALERNLPRMESLEAEVQQLMQEKKEWEAERTRLAERAKEADILRSEGEARSGGEVERLLAEEREKNRRALEEKDADIQQLREKWEADRDAWEQQKAEAEDERLDDLARLQDEMEALRADDVAAAQREVDEGLRALQGVVKQYGIVCFSRDSSLQGLLGSVNSHLETVHAKLDAHARAEAEWEVTKRKLENDVRSGLDKRETLVRDIEDARKERDQAKSEARVRGQSDASIRAPISPSSSYPDPSGDSVGRIMSILQPLWNTLPSPEARAAKFNKSRQQFRAGSPTLNSPGGKSVSSLSDLDVRSLKSLYETTRGGQPPSPGAGGAFTIEAFAARVQALMADDRALIERLVRFAQAHDLLKKNAERAQKLAQEGNTALETYQKQVRTLEDRNMSMAAKQAAMNEEVQHLQDMIERVTNDKTEVEMLAAEQAETCRQLTEANNTLSARALTLAEEAASAPEMVRKQLESQLVECRAALERAQEEVIAMRTSEDSQRIAMMDELNSMQTENGMLRAQLRARK